MELIRISLGRGLALEYCSFDKSFGFSEIMRDFGLKNLDFCGVAIGVEELREIHHFAKALHESVKNL